MIKTEERMLNQSIKVGIQTLESQELAAPPPAALRLAKEASTRAVIARLGGLTQLGDG